MVSFQKDWLDWAQTLGLLVGVILAVAGFVRERRGRSLANFLTLSQLHRDLWAEAHQRPDLIRVFQEEADINEQPASIAEQEFLNLVIVHFQSGWHFSKDAAFITKKSMVLDARDFFSKPLPRAVWDLTREARDPKFVHFMEKAFAPITLDCS